MGKLENWIDPGIRYSDIIAILREDVLQMQKWGIQDRTPFEWLAYLVEEVGSLSKAISEAHYRDGDIGTIVKEAIQVSTLAFKIAKMSGGEIWLKSYREIVG